MLINACRVREAFPRAWFGPGQTFVTQEDQCVHLLKCVVDVQQAGVFLLHNTTGMIAPSLFTLPPPTCSPTAQTTCQCQDGLI